MTPLPFCGYHEKISEIDAEGVGDPEHGIDRRIEGDPGLQAADDGLAEAGLGGECVPRHALPGPLFGQASNHGLDDGLPLFRFLHPVCFKATGRLTVDMLISITPQCSSVVLAKRPLQRAASVGTPVQGFSKLSVVISL